MSEFLIDIKNMELDWIDPMDLAPLVSSADVLIVTVPRDENDKDEDEDEDRNKDKDKDKDEDEEEDGNNSIPELQTDKSSTEDLLEESESNSSEAGTSRLEDEEYYQGFDPFDPPSNIWLKEYQWHNSEPEDVLDRLDQQVKDLLKIMKVKMGWPAVHRYEDDIILAEGLENILVMEDKLSKMVLSLKEKIDRAQRTEARILQLITEDNPKD